MHLNLRLLKLSILLLLLSVTFSSSYALDAKSNGAEKPIAEQKLAVSFKGIDGLLLENVRKHVTLYARLKSDSALNKGELRRLRRQLPKQVDEALRPFGYYLASVSLATTSSKTDLVYHIDLNQPVLVKQVSLKIEGSIEQKKDFDNWVKQYPLSTGKVLDQVVHEQHKKALLSLALRKGYFDAKLTKSTISINKQRTEADIKMVFVTGQQYTISDVNIEWLEGETPDASKKLISQKLIESYLSIEAGDIFDGDELVTSQRNLLATSYFSKVSVRAGDTDGASSSLPINVLLTPKKRHTYSAEIGAGTDTGLRGGLGYENRRVNSRGHNLSARLGGSEIKSSAIVNYQVPSKRSVLDNYNFYASLTEESGDSRRFENQQIGIERVRSWQDSLFKFGLVASKETSASKTDDGFEADTTSNLLMPSISWERTKADDLYFPSHGWSASVTLRGASEDVGSDIDLAQLIMDAKRLYSIGKGRFRFRVKLAASLIDDDVDLPESLGFLAGGDDSVRGYSYESIGVEVDGETEVAKNLATASIEYEHPIKNGISLATFLDVGDAFDDNADYKRGAGVGLRWRLPFGAVRLDAASALDRDGNPIRMHFSFGTDL